MLVCGIRQFGDPVLRETALPIGEITPETKKLIDFMIDTMDTARGVGLAAPQIGVLQRVLVYSVDDKELVYINPEIVEMSGEVISDEGCLSLASIQIPVSRAEHVTVKALDRKGKPIRHKASGMQARVIQHEIDHLDGILIIDRVSPEVRRAALEQYEEYKKREL